MIVPDINPVTIILSIALVALTIFTKDASKIHREYRDSVENQLELKQEQIELKDQQLLIRDSLIYKFYYDYENLPTATSDDIKSWAKSSGYYDEICRLNPGFCD